ncbi:hypothetical protein BDV95DRAFT_380394, partial [Massariosphaeria phaeospora]
KVGRKATSLEPPTALPFAALLPLQSPNNNNNNNNNNNSMEAIWTEFAAPSEYRPSPRDAVNCDSALIADTILFNDPTMFTAASDFFGGNASTFTNPTNEDYFFQPINYNKPYNPFADDLTAWQQSIGSYDTAHIAPQAQNPSDMSNTNNTGTSCITDEDRIREIHNLGNDPESWLGHLDLAFLQWKPDSGDTGSVGDVENMSNTGQTSHDAVGRGTT